MGSSNSRIRSPSSSSPSPKVNRDKPRKFLSLFCGCSSSSHAPIEMEEYPDEILANPSELCGDPLFTKVLKSKEEVHLISSADTGGLTFSADVDANSSIRTDNEGQVNLEQDAGDCESSNHGNLLFESGGLVPPPVSVSSPDGLDRDNNGTTSGTSIDEPQSSEMASVHISSCGIAVYGIGNMVIRGVTEMHSEDGNVIPEVEIVENQGAESRVVVRSSGSFTSEASDLPTPPNSAEGDNSTELIPIRSELPVFDRDQDIEPGSVAEVDVVSVSSSPSSSLTTDSNSWEAQRNSRRSFWDAYSGHSSRVHTDANTPAIVWSAAEDSDYRGSQERWLFDHINLFSDDGGGSRYRGSRIQRSNDWRRRRRLEFWERLHGGLYEPSWHNTSCPLGIHTGGDECSCDQFLTGESSARSSISRIVMLAEALFEVLDEIHRQPMPFSLSMGPVTAPESIVDSFPLKSYEKSSPAGSKEAVEQCNICFAEYEEGDKIRVLPCHHEYHMDCVDKWLKEIHGVCPLCRGDVRQGFMETPASSSELTSS